MNPRHTKACRTEPERGHFGVRMPAPGSQRELWARAQALGGRTLGELAGALGARLPDAEADAQLTKGFVGRLIEDALGSDIDAGERPDFVRLGIELKTVPVRVTHADGGTEAQIVPAESPFLCSIDMLEAQRVAWAESRLRRRLGAVLFVPIERAHDNPWALRRIYAPRLWRPCAAMWELIRADWELLMGSIGAGHSARLCARLGEIIQVRPKAANSASRTLGPDGDGMGPVLPLGFYLRRRVVARVFEDPAQQQDDAARG